MSKNRPLDLTTLANSLHERPGGSPVDALMPAVYDDLRHIAERYFRDERRDHTLQPTALVHEAYLRLIDQTRITWQGRTHFLAVCARTMRRVLVDYARGRQRQRRGGGKPTIEINDEATVRGLSETDILDLSDAIDTLAKLDERQAQVVEMRYFGGMTMDEVADALGASKRTVEGDWTHAKAWLRQTFDSGPTNDA